ncbi:hypothetical protein HK405_015533 [Cladochytrium tenue]|nr:hypothetical protein HK405_015533 [Cladochytrium tenue]
MTSSKDASADAAGFISIPEAKSPTRNDTTVAATRRRVHFSKAVQVAFICRYGHIDDADSDAGDADRDAANDTDRAIRQLDDLLASDPAIAASMFPPPLHTACHYGRLRVAAWLIANGHGVNDPDALGWTPLHWACHGGKAEAIRLLATENACDSPLQVDVFDKGGKLPFDIVESEFSEDIQAAFEGNYWESYTSDEEDEDDEDDEEEEVSSVGDQQSSLNSAISSSELDFTVSNLNTEVSQRSTISCDEPAMTPDATIGLITIETFKPDGTGLESSEDQIVTQGVATDVDASSHISAKDSVEGKSPIRKEDVEIIISEKPATSVEQKSIRDTSSDDLDGSLNCGACRVVSEVSELDSATLEATLARGVVTELDATSSTLSKTITSDPQSIPIKQEAINYETATCIRGSGDIVIGKVVTGESVDVENNFADKPANISVAFGKGFDELKDSENSCVIENAALVSLLNTELAGASEKILGDSAKELLDNTSLPATNCEPSSTIAPINNIDQPASFDRKSCCGSTAAECKNSNNTQYMPEHNEREKLARLTRASAAEGLASQPPVRDGTEHQDSATTLISVPGEVLEKDIQPDAHGDEKTNVKDELSTQNAVKKVKCHKQVDTSFIWRAESSADVDPLEASVSLANRLTAAATDSFLYTSTQESQEDGGKEKQTSTTSVTKSTKSDGRDIEDDVRVEVPTVVLQAAADGSSLAFAEDKLRSATRETDAAQEALIASIKPSCATKPPTTTASTSLPSRTNFRLRSKIPAPGPTAPSTHRGLPRFLFSALYLGLVRRRRQPRGAVGRVLHSCDGQLRYGDAVPAPTVRRAKFWKTWIRHRGQDYAAEAAMLAPPASSAASHPALRTWSWMAGRKTQQPHALPRH